MAEEIIILTIHVYSGDSQEPIEGAAVSFNSNRPSIPAIEAVTDSAGRAVVTVPARLFPDSHIIVLALDHDPALIKDLVPESEGVTCNLRPYPLASANLGWWHRLLGITSFSRERGSGISIGVIDSGVADHPDLRHVTDCGFFSNVGRVPGMRGLDDLNHGTGVVGLLAADPSSGEFYGGVVPGAQVFSAKSFVNQVQNLSTGTHGEVQEAMNFLIKKKVDLINCSFCTAAFSPGLDDVIKDAYDNGVLCVCAAGNKPDMVGYPARSSWTVSVSAIGLRTAVRAYLPNENDPTQWQDDYFFPTFSGRGEKITCCGPGVGMIAAASTAAVVPSRAGLRAASRVFGTSFACPLVCGILAAALAEDRAYLNMDRNGARAAYAAQKLIRLCKSLGFAAKYQGGGMPVL